MILRLRTITHFVRVLIAAFLITQFAGAVSSPLASADAFAHAAASHVHHHQQHKDSLDGRGTADHGGDQSGDQVDRCCALHAFFAGVVPSTIAVEVVAAAGQRLAIRGVDGVAGVDPGRLDRPPRPSSLL